MSTTQYPNRDALRNANDIYLDTMRAFIIYHLGHIQGETVENLIEDVLRDEQVDEFWRILEETDDIASAIDFSYFPLIIKGHWTYVFGQQFNMDLTVQSMLWLIRKGRNSCEHRGAKDLDLEFVRMNLSLIANMLGEINRPDKQHEVEVIRDELDDIAKQLAATSEQLKAAKSEDTKSKKALAKVKEHIEVVKSEKNDYKRNLKTTSKELEETKSERDDYKERLKVKLKELKDMEAEWSASEERLETVLEELEKVKTEREASEERLATVSGELARVQAAKSTSEVYLAGTKSLLTTVTIGNREVQSVFPPLGADSAVRILDRRNIEKKNYLLNLLEQKQPTIIYVQSEKMANLLLTDVVPEEADVIGKHDPQTSAVQETGMLEKLTRGKLIAIVSSGTISTLLESHHIEHFVFCHLAPGLEAFFKRCQPAFISTKNAYLHLIYNGDQDVKGLNKSLTQKYPDRETLEKLYTELRELEKTHDDFINFEDVYSGLDVAKLGIETGLDIFEELRLLERNKEGIRLLPSSGRKLDESKIYDRGEKLKHGITEVCAFQLEQPIEKIWEEIQKKLDVDSEQILREDSIDEVYPSVSEIQSDQQRTETVENDSESDSGDSEANQVPQPERANAKVTEKQLREIQFRSAAGESNSELAKEFNLSPPAIRFIAETTEGTRNEIAVKVVELRINKEGSRPIAWKKIREKLGLHNDHFHQVIRHSEGYLNAVIERIKSLKSADGGWEYNGKLSVLTGIEDIENYLE